MRDIFRGVMPFFAIEIVRVALLVAVPALDPHPAASARPMTEATAAAVLLARLKRLGVDYVFANAGTDFPPLIEALAAAPESGLDLPEALVMPHESAAMGMAHGYFCATGRAQAVMAHTNVGLANCAIGAINAATDHVPILLFSGRTPVTEQGRFGARTVPIGWGQEMRDQAALVREAIKWDYELRYPEQVVELADRAHAIAHSTPKGPVYLSLPREVLCEPCPGTGIDARPLMTPAIAGAERGGDRGRGRHPGRRRAAGDLRPARRRHRPPRFTALDELAAEWGIPVVQYWAVRLALATDHPMNAGVDPEPWLGEADAILVIDSWRRGRPTCIARRRIAESSSSAPTRSTAAFRCAISRADVAIAGETGGRRADAGGGNAAAGRRADRRGRRGARETACPDHRALRRHPRGGAAVGRAGQRLAAEQSLRQPLPRPGARRARGHDPLRARLPDGTACG